MAKPTQRTACDRCHGQKLRCIHTESGPCVRCAKAKATCSWSQSLRSRRPDSNLTINRQKERRLGESQDMAITETISNNQQHAPLPATTPIANFPLGVFASHLPSSSIQPQLDLALSRAQFTLSPGIVPPGVPGNYLSPTSQESSESHNHTTHESINAGPDTMTGSVNWLGAADTNHITQGTPQVCWQQLFNQEWALLSSPTVTPERLPSNPVSDIIGNLQKDPCLLATIRQVSELNVELYAHSTTVPKPPVSLSEPISWKDKGFAIDRTFQLSQRLIEIINKQYPRYLETASMDVSNASPIDTAKSSGLQIDQGFCLLILSCYTRLIEIYDRIFENMQACLDRSSVTAREDYVNLPSVQVGSFSLPHSSATQIVLILQLARHLLTQMGEIIKAVVGMDKGNTDLGAANDGPVTEDTSGTEKLLLSSAINTVKPQEDRLMKRITKLRSTLIELNIL